MQNVTSINATCLNCGTVPVPASRVTLKVYESGSSRYAIVCPICGLASSHPVSWKVAQMLKDARVRVVRGESHPMPSGSGRVGASISEAEADAFAREIDAFDCLVLEVVTP